MASGAVNRRFDKIVINIQALETTDTALPVLLNQRDLPVFKLNASSPETVIPVDPDITL